MIKRISFKLILLLFTAPAFTQVEKNNWLPGVDLSLGHSTSSGADAVNGKEASLLVNTFIDASGSTIRFRIGLQYYLEPIKDQV